MKFKFYNDTERVVGIHPATFVHGCIGNDAPIQHLEIREFYLPVGTYPFVKLWDHGDHGLMLLVSPEREEEG